jgi:hypothetical protein
LDVQLAEDGGAGDGRSGEEISAVGAAAAALSSREESAAGEIEIAAFSGLRRNDGARPVAARAIETGAVATLATSFTGAVTALLSFPRRDTPRELRP